MLLGSNNITCIENQILKLQMVTFPNVVDMICFEQAVPQW